MIRSRTVRPVTARRSSRLNSIAAAAVVLCAFAGCENPAEYELVGRVYSLSSIAGDPLPAVVNTAPTQRNVVHSDRLVLNADGTGSRTVAGVYEPIDTDGTPESYTWEVELTYRVLFGTRIEIGYVCPMYASCIAPPHMVAREVPGGLRAESKVGENGPLLYDLVVTPGG